MKKLAMFIIMFMFLAGMAFGQELNGDNQTESQPDNSITDAYKIELGDGEGSLIVTGDNNTIYLPPESKKKDEQQEAVNEFNEATMSLVLGQTDVVSEDGTVVTFSKIVLQWQGDGSVKVVWTEQ